MSHDGQPAELSSTLYLGISRVPEKEDAGATGDCGPMEALLKVTYMSGDERFRHLDLSGVFKPRAADSVEGTLNLKLGSLSITAYIGDDGAVSSTSSVWHDDGGTRSASVSLARQGR